MTLTTTNTVDGFKIIEYKGLVTGVSSDVKTKFSFKSKKNMTMTSDVIKKAQDEAFEKLEEEANSLNANAVVGIQVDFEHAQGSYFFVTVVGTAVYIAK